MNSQYAFFNRDMDNLIVCIEVHTVTKISKY